MYSDFTRVILGDAGMAGTDGQPVINSGLSGPLANSGTFCRYLRKNGSSSTILYHLNDPDFVDIPVKGVQIIWSTRIERVPDVSQGTPADSMGVYIKNVNNGYDGNPQWFNQPGPEVHRGYGMRFGMATNGSTDNAVALNAGVWIRSAAGDVEDYVTSAPVIGVWQMDTWYTFKFTVIPSGNIQDVLTGYVLTGSDVDNPDDWTQICQLTINNTDFKYIAWAQSGSKMGFYISKAQVTNSGGANYTGYNAYYIDKLSFKLKGVN